MVQREKKKYFQMYRSENYFKVGIEVFIILYSCGSMLPSHAFPNL